jgi:hypothetical protein
MRLVVANVFHRIVPVSGSISRKIGIVHGCGIVRNDWPRAAAEAAKAAHADYIGVAGHKRQGIRAGWETLEEFAEEVTEDCAAIVNSRGTTKGKEPESKRDCGPIPG